jgi:hypothetical protein
MSLDSGLPQRSKRQRLRSCSSMNPGQNTMSTGYAKWKGQDLRMGAIFVQNLYKIGGQACKPDSPDELRNTLTRRKLLKLRTSFLARLCQFSQRCQPWRDSLHTFCTPEERAIVSGDSKQTFASSTRAQAAEQAELPQRKDHSMKTRREQNLEAVTGWLSKEELVIA